MKVSFEWLKTLVNIEGISLEQLVSDLSLYSVEVEGTSAITNASDVVIGYVIQKEKHPNSDKLSYCLVNVGNKVLPIVCGAPNVEAGQKVMVVLPGGQVFGHEIKTSTIRGVTSDGMICSFQEVGLEPKFIPEKYANGIVVLDNEAPIGLNALAYLGLDDYQIELGLTPNRMDLLSMRGVAKDVNAIYQQGLFDEDDITITESELLTSDEIKVSLVTSRCHAYHAKVIKDVVIKESPNFIKARLIASGIRPINNVVDITNYILMLFGQPLHAFDQDKLGKEILVRRAKEKEETITLDGQKRSLSKEDIVITNGQEIVAIGGVMGCANTEVTNKTKNIVLEAAVFRPLNIRQTSSRLGLRSEASVRFERGVDLNTTVMALNYASYLLEKYASGKVSQGIVSEGITSIKDRLVKISVKEVNDTLGLNLSCEELLSIFKRLDFKVTIKGNTLEVNVPNRRLDIMIKEDLIEEVVRIYGYDKLPETLPKMPLSGERSMSQKKKELIKQTLNNLGLKEVITYSLSTKVKNTEFSYLLPPNSGAIKLLHPMTEERTEMRLGIVRSLIDIIKYNKARKQDDLAFFELGKRYYLYNNQSDDIVENWVLAGSLTGRFGGTSWQGKTQMVDFFMVKGILDILFRRLGLKVKYLAINNQINELHPEQSASIILNNKEIGYLGTIHPKYAKAHDLDKTIVFEVLIDDILLMSNELKGFMPIPKVPHVERDLALVMDQNQSVGDVIEAIIKTDEKMITNVEVFDLYLGEKVGEGKKSVALRIILEASDTLTEDIIQAKIKKILKMLEYRFSITLRV